MRRYFGVAIGLGLIGTHLSMLATGYLIGRQSVPQTQPWVTPSPESHGIDRRYLPYEMHIGGSIDDGLTWPEPSLLPERPEGTISSRVDMEVDHQ